MQKGNSGTAKKLFFIFLLGLLGVGGYLLFRDTSPPAIHFSHTSERVSPAHPLNVTVTDDKSGIRRIRILARYHENEIPVVQEEYADNALSRTLTFTLGEAGLKNDDTFDLEITAVDSSFGGFGFGNKQTLIIPMRVDSIPPRIQVKSTSPNVRKGGTGCLVYALSEEVTETGVRVSEDLFFPAFRQDNGDYICFFGFPYNMETKDYTPRIVARDMAGNIQDTPADIRRMDRKFKSDSIAISQNFLDSKAAEFSAMHPGDMTEIERFLFVNGPIRRENARDLMRIGKDTASEMLWEGAFERLPRAASRAGFADHRTYLWEGREVDQQTHLGFDLASTKWAPVPASNAGRVVYAGYLGIYGNLVVLDHGLGLQSLYSHLSQIDVVAGQNVEQGKIIGKTGQTGMAGGDHLHFGILVSGLEVTPLEWLDDHWIKDNIVDRIIEAGGKAPRFPQPPAPVPTPEKAAKKKR